jgi:hypothetical protein
VTSHGWRVLAVLAAAQFLIVENYADAQLTALKTGLLFAGLLVCAAFLTTRRLPTAVPAARGSPDAAAA